MSGGSSTTTTAPWKGQEPYLKAGFGEAARLYGQGVPGYYPGQTTAAPGVGELQGWMGTQRYIGGPRAGAQQAAAESAMIGGLSGGVNTQAFNPMISAMGRQVQGQLQNQILPGIRESLVYHQPGGSTRGNLEQNKAIASAVQSGLTNKAAEMYGGAYESAQDRATKWGSMYPSIMSAPVSMYGALGQVGGEMREAQQRGIDADMHRYQYAANAPQQALANYMNMIQGNYGGTTAAPRPGGGIGGALGSLASAALMGFM